MIPRKAVFEFLKETPLFDMNSFLEKLKKDVQCTLCGSTLTEPKLLECFHTFCKLCIERHAEVNVFKCPECKSETSLPELNSVENLKPSLLHSRILKCLSLAEGEKVCSVSENDSTASWYCFDCSRSICDLCLKNHSLVDYHTIINLNELTIKDLELVLRREEDCTSCCVGQRVELFCRSCQVLICVFCMKQAHVDHDLISLEMLVAHKKEILDKHLEVLEKLKLNDQETQEQENIASFIKKSGEKAMQEVENRTKQVTEMLLRNERELLEQINSKMQRAIKNLNIIHHIQSTKEHINSIMEKGLASDLVNIQEKDCCEDFIFNPLPQNNILEIFFVANKEILGQVAAGIGEIHTIKVDHLPDQSLQSLLQEVVNAELLEQEPNTENEGLSVQQETLNLTVMLEQENTMDTGLVEVQSYCETDHTMSTVKVESEPMALKQAKLVLITNTSTGEPNHDPSDVIDVKISPEENVEIKENSVKTDGKIEVEFIPKVPGQLTAEVQVNGHHVSNSPLVMNVQPQQMVITREFKMKGGSVASHTLTGIAVNKENSKIAVAYESCSCINVFNTEGDLLFKYGRKGKGERQLLEPEGLAFLDETNLAIADNRNDRLCIVNTSTGALVKTFGKHGVGDGEFNDSYGLHVDDDGNIVACDYHNHRVQVFTRDGEYDYQFGLTKEDHFTPVCAVSHLGRFFVSDHTNNTIHVFEKKDGEMTRNSMIGEKGSADGQLMQPWGLTIDNDHHLLVCDRGNNRIQKFTLDGRFVGKTHQKLKDPRYVTVLNDGTILVTTFRSGLFVVSNVLEAEKPTRRSGRARRH